MPKHSVKRSIVDKNPQSDEQPVRRTSGLRLLYSLSGVFSPTRSRELASQAKSKFNSPSNLLTSLSLASPARSHAKEEEARESDQKEKSIASSTYTLEELGAAKNVRAAPNMPFKYLNNSPEDDELDVTLTTAKILSSKPPPKIRLMSSTSPPEDIVAAAPKQILKQSQDPLGSYGYESDAIWTPESSDSPVVDDPSAQAPEVTQNSYDEYDDVADMSWTPTSTSATSQKSPSPRPFNESNSKEGVEVDNEESIVVPSIINRESSFSDFIVYRNSGDTSFTSSSIKPCSATANLVDIARIERSARQLFAAYPDSPAISSALLARLERMVRVEVAKVENEAKTNRKMPLVPPKVLDSVTRLKAYLRAQKSARVEMGEREEDVGLELRWAEWMVQAAECGVMHLKVVGCTCWPELREFELSDTDARDEDDEDEDEDEEGDTMT